MSKDMIKVKYIGKWDAMICDYNGKRYAFRAKERVSVIPSVVYDFIKQAKDHLSMDLIPYQEDLAVPETPNKPDTSSTVFVALSLKEYAKLPKEQKQAYKLRKAEAEKENGK